MDTKTPRREDDLSDLERRLSGWRPGAEGLDADAMLFAAGLAAGRSGRGRRLAPALCGLLAVLALGLGAWGLSERAECVALAGRLPQRAPSVPQAPAVAALPEPRYSPSPDDYFHLRRRLEQDPGRWLASAPTVGAQTVGPPPPGPSILRAGQHNGPLPQ